MSSSESYPLNAIVPYFTMFPLDFPLRVLTEGGATPGERVLDPFCGRGTTNYAARLLGIPSVGIDSNPVAAATTQAKLADTTPAAIVRAARRILGNAAPVGVPTGPFWELAYHPDTLADVCRLRRALIDDCSSPSRIGLRAVLLGILHGPRNRGTPSYLSNQCQRTYAPKPAYAVRFWTERQLTPVYVDVVQLIERRARRCFGHEQTVGHGSVILGDARSPKTMARVGSGFSWVVTSPPYYGLRTYPQDQWLRNWFLGEPAEVDYHVPGQVSHASQHAFASDLAAVWQSVGRRCRPGAVLVMRFGSITDRTVDPAALASASLGGTGWRIDRIASAGTAANGRRQALHMAGRKNPPREEIDIYAQWEGHSS